MPQCFLNLYQQHGQKEGGRERESNTETEREREREREEGARGVRGRYGGGIFSVCSVCSPGYCVQYGVGEPSRVLGKHFF